MVLNDVQPASFKIKVKEQVVINRGRQSAEELQMQPALSSTEEQRLIHLMTTLVDHAAFGSDAASFSCTRRCRALSRCLELSHGCGSVTARVFGTGCR